jgi:sugar/nucleoside kinase (ribokinase family)
MELDVYALGNALVDIRVQVEDSLLTKLGLKKGNRYLTERKHQEEILQSLFGSDSLESARKTGKLQIAAAGSAANTMHGVSQLGGRAGFCGKIGNEELGALYAEHMKQSGVIFRENTGQGMTGSCVVLISNDTQRTMLTCLGISGQIDYKDIDEELLKSSKYLYLEGYLFESECAAHVDLLFANTSEAQVLSGTNNIETALCILSGWCEIVAVTGGEHGSTVSFNGEITKIPPHRVSAIDTTGAGDAYAAGLLYGITQCNMVEESCKIASIFSAEVVAQIAPHHSGDIPLELKKLL